MFEGKNNMQNYFSLTSDVNTPHQPQSKVFQMNQWHILPLIEVFIVLDYFQYSKYFFYNL